MPAHDTKFDTARVEICWKTHIGFNLEDYFKKKILRNFTFMVIPPPKKSWFTF